MKRSLLILLVSLSFFLTGADAHAQSTLATFTNSAQNYRFQYPAGWTVEPDAVDGRYSSLHGTRLSSAPIPHETIGREGFVPRGGVAALVRFEGRNPGLAPAEYAAREIASPEYTPTGRAPTFGTHATVELSGETGRLIVLALGEDVYTFFLPADNDSSADAALDAVIASFAPLANTRVALPRDERALPGLAGGTRVPSAPNPAIPNVFPAMKMPWDASARYYFTGGPHNGISLVDCAPVPLAGTTGATGLDFGLSYNEVLNAADGTLAAQGFATGSIGYYVIIDHGGGWSTRYWHLSSIDPMTLAASIGTSVPRGRLLGVSGTAGTGPHLHLELRYNTYSTNISWHGQSIDGYTARALIPVTDTTQALNYEGTLTRGTETASNVAYAPCKSMVVTRWSGASGTIEAGSAPTVVSTNLKSFWPCTPGVDEVAFFLDINYTNQCAVRGVGAYADAAAMGLPNDSLSSVRVGSNVRVTLYRDAEYGGLAETLSADAPDLRNNAIGNDLVSAARVFKRGMTITLPLVER